MTDAERIDSLQFKLQELRGRFRYVNNEASRKLGVALEALRADPPWIEAADERIEDVIQLLQREVNKLPNP